MIIIRFRGQAWNPVRGESLTIGRSRGCVLRLPDDDHLSRHAGTVHVLDDCVLVRNDSYHKPLVLRPLVGEDRVVEPRAATASLPYLEFSVLFVGRGGAVTAMEVDARALTTARRASAGVVTRAPETVTRPLQMTPSQHLALVALCAPVLTRTGPDARPASYAEIGRRLGRQPQYIRNVLKSLRESLSGHGVPGLTDEDNFNQHDDFRWALARWALRSGWVDLDSLPALPAKTGG
jgi:hypothetical protein